ncbi:MAG: protein kinase [Pirellulaceae bacterium]|nr:protein kinase [Pirellulaceae bacterium]
MQAAASLHDTSADALDQTADGARPGVKPDVRELCNRILSPLESECDSGLGQLGGYRVISVLGTGGMGIVFKAEDPQLKRVVALKAMNPSVAAGSQSASERFMLEAQATAAIQQDNIVTIYQVGEDRGIPFLAMQLLEGESLADRLRRETSLPLDETLRIAQEICAGLAAAHEKGLTHRDIKPDNVWLEANTDRVKILDFGLARAVDGRTDLTQSGAIVGTPSFLAPEQARAEKIDHRADLFSLGAALYQMTTGKSPFSRSNLMATLHAVTLEEPTAPAELDAAIPTGVSNLIMKLLEKDPDQRVQTAGDVIEQIQQFEMQAEPTSKPTPSRDVATATSFWSTGRGKTLVAIAAAATALLLAAVIYVKTDYGTLVVKAGRDYEVTTDNQTVIIRDKKTKREIKVQVGENSLASGDYLIDVTDNDGLSFSTRELKIVRGQNRDLVVTLAPTVVSVPPIKEDQGFATLALVQDPAKLNGEDIPWTIARVEPVGNTCARVRPDGGQIAAFSADGAIRVWDTQTSELLRIFFGASAGPLLDSYGIHGYQHHPLSWSPGGNHLVICDNNGELRVFDANTGKQLFYFQDHVGLLHAEWSPKGSHLAAIFDDGRVCVWNSKTWEISPSLKMSTGSTRIGLAWSPDGKTLATTTNGNTDLYLWDIERGKANLLRTPRAENLFGNICSIAWSPDGKEISAVAAKYNTIFVWSVADGVLNHTLMGESILAVAWSNDGTMLAAGSRIEKQNQVIAWKAKDGSEAFRSNIDFKATDVRWLHGDKEIMVQDLDANGAVGVIDVEAAAFQALAGRGSPHVSVDGKTVVYASRNEEISIYVDGKETKRIEGMSTTPTAIRCSPDQRFVAVEGSNTLVVWNSDDGRVVLGPIRSGGHPTNHHHMRWSPRNGQLLTGRGYGSIWEMKKEGALIKEITLKNDVITGSTSWSPDGKLVALASFSYANRGTIEIHDASTGELVVTHTVHLRPGGSGIDWSRDGKMLAFGSNRVELLAADSEEKLGVLEGFGDGFAVNTIVFSADGRHLMATAKYSGKTHWIQQPHPTCIIWDMETRKPLQRLLGKEAGATVAAFSPDSKTIAIRSDDGKNHFFDVASGDLIRSTKGIGRSSPSDSFSPSLDTLFTSRTGAIQIWNLVDETLIGTLIPGGTLPGVVLPMAVTTDGHYQSTGDVMEQIRYVVKTSAGQKMLTPVEFGQQYGWQNHPDKVRFLSTLERE